MSTAPAQVPHTPSLRPRESYGEKAWRKFKEEPLIPIGTCVTIYALVMAAVKLNRRESRSFNYWLRARIAGQALTVGAVYLYYQRRAQDTAALQQNANEQYADREKKEFEGRLKVAEAQWKENQGSDQSKDQKSAGNASPAKSQVPGSGSGSSWWRMNWLWRTSTPSASDKKPS